MSYMQLNMVLVSLTCCRLSRYVIVKVQSGVMLSSFAASGCTATGSHVVHTLGHLNQWLITSLFSFVEGGRTRTAYPAITGNNRLTI